jgi:CheY-like chemotaxis protein
MQTNLFNCLKIEKSKKSKKEIWLIIEDISKRKKIERNLKISRENAENASRTKSEFIANVSHEIRTPMNGVLGMSELLLETHLSPDQKLFTETIKNSANNLLEIINDILDFSKVESGKIELEFRPFHLRTLIEEVLDMLSFKASEKYLDLVYIIPERIPDVFIGDSLRIKQILLNLVSNAIKFTSKGQVVIYILGQPWKEGAGSHQRWQMSFCVEDTGIGIPKNKLEKLFKAFSQIDASTARIYGGTGLGLVICKKIAEVLGGSITVESEENKGSKFTCRIMLQQSSESKVMENETFLKEKKILVVDDNFISLQMLRQKAESWGMIVETTQDPKTAITLTQQNQPYDFVIIDLYMPDMDGIQLGKKIRNNSFYSSTQLILLTCNLTKEFRRKSEKAGFDLMLTKPIHQTKLEQTLIDILKKTSNIHEIDPNILNGINKEKKLNILLAEDHPVNQQVALLQLKKLGYSADIARNGIEVLELLTKKTYDLILLDCKMPEMDGYETSRKIRMMEREGVLKKHLPLIALTAHVANEEQEKCTQAGMSHFLSKPVKLEVLRKLLDQIIIIDQSSL